MIVDLTGAQTPLIPQNSSHATDKRTAMPSRLFAVLAICIATSGLLATTPSAAFSRDANSQMEVEAAVHLTCVKEAEHFICEPEKAIRTGENLGQHRGTTDATRVTATVIPQFLNSAQQALVSNSLLGLTYLLPIGLGLGILMCDKYANYRSAFLRQQVEILERIWQQRHQH